MDANSIFEAFEAAAKRYSGRPFLCAPAAAGHGCPVEWSYSEASREVARLQRLYAARGLPPGARAAVAFDSRLDVYLHLLALNGLGISMVPLNMAGADSELAFLLRHSDCSLVVAAAEHAARLARLPVPDGPGVVSLPAFDAGGQGNAPAVAGARTREAALLYTSGTTGSPKGCMLSNEYFLALGDWYNALGGPCTLTPDDRLLTPLPPHHMNALCTSFMAALLAGACVVQLDRFHPSTWWQTVREERATIVHYLGVMPAILLTLPPSADDLGTPVRFGFGAGSDPRHQETFEQRFGFPLLEAWAMTETGAGAVTIADREPRHIGQRCIGRPCAGMEYRIVDEFGDQVPPGFPGEFLVRTRGDDPRRNFFSGYYKDEQATREAWGGGWFHTGDVVREGTDGSLYFVDRQKNIIRRSGENVAAVEVEAALLGHPGVLNCAVAAVPDELRGEEVFAFVVPNGTDARTDATALVDHCLERLAYFKVPGWFAFVPELPLTASQKINRAAVKEQARKRVAEGDCLDLRGAKTRRRARAS